MGVKYISPLADASFLSLLFIPEKNYLLVAFYCFHYTGSFIAPFPNKSHLMETAFCDRTASNDSYFHLEWRNTYIY